MKKMALGALALTTVIGLSAMSPLTTAAAAEVYFSQNSSPAEIQAIKEREEKISDLIEKRLIALQTTGAVPPTITKELATCGVEEMSVTEINTFLSNTDSYANSDISLMDEGHYSDHSYITESENNIFERYSIDMKINGIEYTYMNIIATPKNMDSNLYTKGRLESNNKNKLLATANFLSFAGETILGNKNSTIARSIAAVFSIYNTITDAIGVTQELINSLKPTSVVETIGADYTYYAAEVACFTYVPSSTISNHYILLTISNMVEMQVTATIPTFELVNGTPDIDSIQTKHHSSYRNYFFASGAKVLYGRYGDGIPAAYNERLESFEVHGIDGEYLGTVNLPNPSLPGNIN